MKFRISVLLLALLAMLAVGVVLSRENGRQSQAESSQLVAKTVSVSETDESSMHMDMGAHMKMSAARKLRPGDQERAESIAVRARQATEKYRDYRVALREGFQILQPQVAQQMYHFNHFGYAAEAERHFNAEHPTSLLYEKTGGGYRLIGVMYTAPADMTEEELDKRIPLSVARWHQHVNVCLPPGEPLQVLFGQGKKFGLDGSISTREACNEAGGQFHARLFGWMVHLYPDETTPEAMWSVERQAAPGGHHAH
jgi:hypothetical protein